MRKGKAASTSSARREKVDQNSYVLKARKWTDARPCVESSQPHMDYSSQVLDPTPTHDDAVYEKGFVGYDRMEEDIMFYQSQDEAEDEEVAGDEEVPEDVVADYLEAENVIPEGESEPQTKRRRRVPQIPAYPVGGPPFLGGLETTSLLSDYARHVANLLWVNHHNMWYDQADYKCINAWKKMKELGKPEEGLRWFWEPVEGSCLHDLIYTGYSTVTHAMISAMCKRWHTETSSFHLHVGETTITLDDVHNLLHIPIHGHMLDHDEAMSQDRAINLMTRLLGMSDVDARVEVRTESASHISYPTLKRVYEHHLIEARRLDKPQTREELQERGRMRVWCVRSFLLYLVGCALFTNKTNRHFDLIYLDCMADLQAIGKWSWGGMALAYLYAYLDDSVILNNRTMAWSTTLFMMDFGAFVRSVPKEEKQGVDAGENMCLEMAYLQRA